MKDLLFMLADLWMIFAGFFYGWKFIRRYNNYLLGLEASLRQDQRLGKTQKIPGLEA